jgi:2-polyprenyl-6-methoxyphenol hydroxylase-like FAD-dependent oxidoreductase
VSGLSSALALGRHGHEVIVVERDDTPMPATANEAFDWNRRGAPQVRHSHAFLARLVGLLRRNEPELYAALLAEGATEMRFGDDLPPTITNFQRLPDDDDLVMLACRRTTFEWLLRRAALQHGNVSFRTGVGVAGLISDADNDAVPHVVGIRLENGTEVRADLTVVAAGRRSVLPEWLAAIGAAPVQERVEDTGIVYFSRFYRLKLGASYPPRSGPIGGDLGYLKYGVFVGDNGTFSVTLAANVADDEMRKLLADPATFDRFAQMLVATAPWLDGRAEPLLGQDGADDGVHVMAGLLNRWRDFVVDGSPVATGFVPVGDAVLCTNPLYGRGCSTGFWGATLLADAVAAHGADSHAVLVAYDQSLRAEIYPWYRAGVEQDAEARRVATALMAGDDPDGDTTDPRTFMRGVFRDGLLPALRTDAVVLRAFFRTFNLLSTADSMATDPDIGARVLAVWQERDNRPPEPALGPKRRAELLELLR